MQRSVPRANGRRGALLRRPRNGRSNRRLARTVARVCRREQAAGRGSGRGRRRAMENSVPRGQPPAEISALRKRLPGHVVVEVAERPRRSSLREAPRGRPRGYVAASKRRGGGVDAAAGRPRRLASRTDGCAGVSPRTSGGEGGEREAKRTRRGHRTAKEISAPRRRLCGCVTADERWGGEGERRPAVRRCEDQRPTIVVLRKWTSDGEGEWMWPREQPLGHVAADER